MKSAAMIDKRYLSDPFDEKQSLEQLALLISAGESQKIFEFMAELKDSWDQIQMADYLTLLLKACERISSIPFIPQIQKNRLLIDQLSFVLKGPASMPVAVELKLLLLLPLKVDKKERKQNTRLWLGGLSRLLDSLDPEFDVSDQPLRNMAPPAYSSGRSGMAAGDITNKSARESYETLLAQNRSKANIFNEQYRLRSLEQQFVPKLKRYLDYNYDDSTEKQIELSAVLTEYGLDMKTVTDTLVQFAK